MFLEKFFPASRTVTIRKEICAVEHWWTRLQQQSETPDLKHGKQHSIVWDQRNRHFQSSKRSRYD
ncbi:hypothetical protein CR513_01415, partial [Mucuna pruriens]